MTTLLALALLPLYFEPNHGQVSSAAQYLAHGSGYEIELDGGRAHIRRGPMAFTLRFAGANRDPKGEALERQTGVSNYLIGRDPAHWRQNVPHFGRIRYNGIYPGIDVVYYGRPEAMEYDLLLAPGADASRIHLGFEGARRLRLSRSGDLIIQTPGGELRQRRPAASQDGHSVECRYVLHRAEVQLKLGPYDRARPLVIDPILSLEYSFPFPGVGAIAVDSDGSAYVTGSGSPPNSQAAGVTIAKLTPAGDALLYSTYVGGEIGGLTVAFGIATDRAGNAYVGGETTASDFPVTKGAFQTTPPQGNAGFLCKLDRSGGLVYSTLLGGPALNPLMTGNAVEGIAADAAGNVYAAGTTAGIPPTAGALQLGGGGFLVKLNPSGSALIESASLGGLSPSAVAIDASGAAYLAGSNFVMKLNPTASAIVYQRSFDGSAASIALDPAGNTYVTGTTQSPAFPTTSGSFQPNSPAVCPPQSALGPPVQCGHGFVFKLSPDGQFVYSTYLGGSAADSSASIAVDSAGEAYVAGYTDSQDFPLSSPLRVGGEGPFLTKLNAAGSGLVFSTALSANYILGTPVTSGVALDAAGNAYVASSNLVTKVAVVPGPKIANAGVVNGASLLPGPLAPGEIITIFGAGLGPVKPAAATTNSSGSIGTSVGGTQVLIGGIPAPILYAQANQVNAVVPFGVTGTLASVAVINQGSGTEPVDVLLAPVAPAIFSADGSGAGSAAILNQDGKLNTPLHPAQQGEFISIYATGGGRTNPAESDGQVATGTSTLALPVEVTIGGLAAEVVYAGGAPTLVAGAIQVNARVPTNAPTGPNVPITLTVGGVTSAPLVTLAIRNRQY